jgi:hypothetical protein
MGVSHSWSNLVLKASLIFIFAFATLSLHADDDDQLRPHSFGVHRGYVSDVQEERNRRDIEMVMLDKPKEDEGEHKTVIVNEKLTKEFQQQYAYKFGQTGAEQILNIPSRTDEYTYYTGEALTIKQYQKYQRDFAAYMGRRLTEYHVDNYAKNDRDFRAVYEFKDRVSNLNVNVAKYKFKWKYNFAGPNMDLRLENPYDVDLRVRAEMNGIISTPEEVIYSLGYPINPRISVSALYRQMDGLYQLVGTRRMTKHISTSLTGSVDTLKQGPIVQQNLILVGLSWNE